MNEIRTTCKYFKLLRVFCLGFGGDVQWHTLEEIAKSCNNDLTEEIFDYNTSLPVSFIERTTNHDQISNYFKMMAGYINSAENNLKSKKEHFEKRIEESRKEKETKLRQA